jgi:hypothetical protein
MGMVLKNKLSARKATKQKSNEQPRHLLIKSLRAHLLPVLIKQGFEVAPLVHSGPVDREFTLTLPLGRLRRYREAVVDLVEIQFKTYRRPAFRINAGVAPKDGLMTYTGHRAGVEELDASGLPDHFEMYACPRWWIWFSLWLWRFRSPVQAQYDRLALRVAGFVPELELVLREGRLGPHMRRIMIPWPAPLHHRENAE